MCTAGTVPSDEFDSYPGKIHEDSGCFPSTLGKSVSVIYIKVLPVVGPALGY